MQFSKITGLALALAPLAMAGACPVKNGNGVTAPVSTPPAQVPAHGHDDHKKHHGHQGHKSGDEPVPDAPKQQDPPKQDPPKQDPPKQDPPKQDPPKQDPPKQDPAPKDPAPEKPSGDGKASPVTNSPKFVGKGTLYGLDYDAKCRDFGCWPTGSCSFVDYTLPKGIDGTTCVSDAIWDNGANCGGCISVTYKGKKLTIMVTNRTDGLSTHLDMPSDTYHQLTDSPWGGVDGIEWEWITCPITTPLAIKLHGGASKYWFAATVYNANLRTAKLEVSVDEGKTWLSTHREVFNSYTLGRQVLSVDKAYVRVTSVEGQQVIVKDVVLQSGAITTAESNY
ncbi:hypothetical protein E4U55_008228 [Claviceps digitariae]|nr:hypothetical protein E4U55_008228 [Claviceps digitariae]